MQKMLPKEVYKNVLNAIEGREKIKARIRDTIAVAMKEWAISQGATHYSHWFQPSQGQQPKNMIHSSNGAHTIKSSKGSPVNS